MARTKWLAASMFMLFLLVVIGGYLLLRQGTGEGAGRAFRVGVLGSPAAFGGIADGFKARMTELGYVEGKDIVYDVQVGDFDEAGLKRVAREYVEDKVDMIFVFPTEPAKTAKEASRGTSIPVVFSIAGLEGNNLVESVRQPGGNATGVRYPGPDLVVKRFEILLELAPHIKRHFIPYSPSYPTCLPALEALRPAASSQGVTLVEVPVASVEEIRAALEALAATGNVDIDSIQILPEALTQSPAGWAAISDFAREHRLPLVGSILPSARIGGVFSYCIDFPEVGALAAPVADKILRGAQPGRIPVVTPEAHLWVNCKVIRELGLSVSEGLLARADKVFR